MFHPITFRLLKLALRTVIGRAMSAEPGHNPDTPSGNCVQKEIIRKSIDYVPGPIGTTVAGDNNQLLVAMLAVTNKLWSSPYTNEFIHARRTTDDDEKTDTFTLLKGKRDEAYEGRSLDLGEMMTVRVVFTIPKKAKATKLNLAEVVDNGKLSHALVYDIPATK